MERKNLYCLIYFCFCILSLSAQNAIFSTNQQLIYNAIEDGVYLVKIDYLLVENETGNHFGRGGKDKFSTIYTVGFRTANGSLFYDKIMKPWSYDDSFQKYKNNYHGLVKNIEIVQRKSNIDSAFVRTISLDTCRVDSLYNNGFILFKETDNGKGFLFNNSEDYNNGWMLWLSIDDDDHTEYPYLHFSIIKVSGNVLNDDSVLNNPPSGNQLILGGLFLVPEITNIGQLTFKVNGIIDKKENKWEIVNFGDAVSFKHESDIGKEDGLTPIEAKDRKKKSKKKK